MIQLLTEMDGFQEISDVIVVAATNRPEILDPAIVRPGRFSESIYISLPDAVARKDILKIGCRDMMLGEDVDLEQLAKDTEGYSGAEIIQLCSSAGYNSIQRSLDDDRIVKDDFEKAKLEVRPQVDVSLIQAYERFAKSAALIK